MPLQIQYYLFFSFACFSVIQITATIRGYRGLMFLKNNLLSIIFNFLLFIGAFAWFFTYENRNVMGLEGSQQFYMFLPSGATGVALTLLLSLVTKVKNPGVDRNKSTGSGDNKPAGMDLLRNLTYIDALRESFKKKG